MDYEKLLSESDMQLFKISGWGKRAGLGKKPVLMIIDAQNKFVGIDRPILESCAVYPAGIGERAFRAMEKINLLIDAARAKGIPIFYTSGLPAKEKRYDSFAKKLNPPKGISLPPEADAICSVVAPERDDLIIYKHCASPFFGTHLIADLNAVHCDTLLVTGFVTSGCIRAFVIDGVSYNFNVIVAEDGVADKFDYSHKANLLDMDMKYADVTMTEDIVKYINSL
jgi:nicotinamidase-related amidase